jgi:[ribosomal protein S18]-alanine N-acetyltransferase
VIEIERRCFTDPWSMNAFRDLEDNPRVLFAGAREGAGSPLSGYVVAWFAADEGEIANLAVAPEARGSGIGAALLDEALAEAGRRGASAVYLEVRDSNDTARRLYGSRGFEEVGRRRGYYRRPVEDAVILRRTINSAVVNAER